VVAPDRLSLPDGVEPGPLPAARDLAPGGTQAPFLLPGGATAGSERASAWLAGPVADYDATRDDLGLDRTSRLSPYLHFGCISAVALATQLAGRSEAEAYLRQLCWRDFYAQLLTSRPELAREDFRPRGAGWVDDVEALAAWKAGLTGYPVVDAAMRQLLAEGFVHNRARMVAASFLTKHLGVDWREGARHYAGHLVDGDVASNSGNWQWVAGTGANTKPHRVFNPTLQGQRYDRAGDYVRRWVPELATVAGAAVHEPWKLAPACRAGLGYPLPLVDHADAVARYRGRLGGGS
jgi:deoxyribodipyrimidine photo-lyase